MKKGSCSLILLYVSEKAAMLSAYSVSLLIQTAKLPTCIDRVHVSPALLLPCMCAGPVIPFHTSVSGSTHTDYSHQGRNNSIQALNSLFKERYSKDKVKSWPKGSPHSIGV